MPSSLSFNIDNPNMNMLQDNETTNRVVCPPVNSVLANRIAIIF